MSFAAADANFLESMRAGGRWQGGELVEEGGLLLVAGRRRWPAGYINCAARLDPSLPASEVLARARAFFSARERGFTLFVREPVDGDLIAATAGLPSLPPSPWMIARARFAPPPNVTLRFCEDERALDEAIQTCAEAYPSLQLPSEMVLAQFVDRARVLAESRVVVAELDGAPASTAMLIHTGGVAGVYWVATRTNARGHRLAEACVAAVANAGLDAGAELVSLQASVMGAPVYTRMGFEAPWMLRWVIFSKA